MATGFTERGCATELAPHGRRPSGGSVEYKTLRRTWWNYP
jgi:hypothetical protein